MVDDEGRKDGLGAQVFDAGRRLGTGIGLDLPLQASDEADGGIRFSADEVTKETV